MSQAKAGHLDRKAAAIRLIQKMTRSDMAVFWCMEMAQNEEGISWLSQDTIAKATKLCERTVRTAVHHLIEIGAVEVVRAARIGSPAKYRICPDAVRGDLKFAFTEGRPAEIDPGVSTRQPVAGHGVSTRQIRVEEEAIPCTLTGKSVSDDRQELLPPISTGSVPRIRPPDHVAATAAGRCDLVPRREDQTTPSCSSEDIAAVKEALTAIAPIANPHLGRVAAVAFLRAGGGRMEFNVLVKRSKRRKKNGGIRFPGERVGLILYWMQDERWRPIVAEAESEWRRWKFKAKLAAQMRDWNGQRLTGPVSAAQVLEDAQRRIEGKQIPLLEARVVRELPIAAREASR